MINWSALTHAEGPADDMPALLADLPGKLWRLEECLIRPGTVFSAAVAAVPFLLDFARGNSRNSGQAAWIVADLLDPRNAGAQLFGSARDAVAEQWPLPLDHPDGPTRAAAAFLWARSGNSVAVLRGRRLIEGDPAVRTSLLIAEAEADQSGLPARFPFDGSDEERYAAAYVLARAGHRLPDGAAASAVAAINAGARMWSAWETTSPVGDLLRAADDRAAPELVTILAADPDPRTRLSLVAEVSSRGWLRRSATARLVPLVAPLIDDPDPAVQAAVVEMLRSSGRIAGRFRDAVAAVAAGYPATDGRWNTPQRHAVEILRLLGDPRWLEISPSPEPHEVRLGMVAFSPELLSAVREILPGRPELADLIGSWGPAAADAVPDLLALLPAHGPAAARALARLGHADPASLPHLLDLAEAGDLYAAAAVRRLTGDPQHLVGALAGRLAEGRGVTQTPELGPSRDLLPLVPAAREHLTGHAVRNRGPVQVLAARVILAATADPATVLTTLWALLERGRADAAELLAALLGPDRDLLDRLDELTAREDRSADTIIAYDLLWADDDRMDRLIALRASLQE